MPTSTTTQPAGPTFTGTDPISVPAGGKVRLLGLTMIDAAAAANPGAMTVTISTEAGTVDTISQGATITGGGSHALHVTGTFAQIGVALAGLTYTAPPLGTGDTIRIDAWDQYGHPGRPTIPVAITGAAVPQVAAVTTGAPQATTTAAFEPAGSTSMEAAARQAQDALLAASIALKPSLGTTTGSAADGGTVTDLATKLAALALTVGNLAAPAVQTSPANITLTTTSGGGSFGHAFNAMAADAAAYNRDIILKAPSGADRFYSYETAIGTGGVGLFAESRRRGAIQLYQGNALPVIAVRGGEGPYGNDPGYMTSDFTCKGIELISKGIPFDSTAPDGLSSLFVADYGYRLDIDLVLTGGRCRHAYIKGDWDGDLRLYTRGGGHRVGSKAAGSSISPEIAPLELRYGAVIGVPAVQVVSNSKINAGNDTNNNLRFRLWGEYSPCDAPMLLISGQNSVNLTMELGSKGENLQAVCPQVMVFDNKALHMGNMWLAQQGGGTVTDFDYMNQQAGNPQGKHFTDFPMACDTMFYAENSTIDGIIHASIIGGGPKWNSFARFKNCPRRPDVFDVTPENTATQLKPGGQFVVLQ